MAIRSRGIDQLFTDCPVFPSTGVVLQAPRLVGSWLVDEQVVFFNRFFAAKASNSCEVEMTYWFYVSTLRAFDKTTVA